MHKRELPRHQVELSPFSIARYPTTNAMFQCFLEAGGYQDERWWSEARAAKVWRKDGTVKDSWSCCEPNPSTGTTLASMGRTNRWLASPGTRLSPIAVG